MKLPPVTLIARRKVCDHLLVCRPEDDKSAFLAGADYMQEAADRLLADRRTQRLSPTELYGKKSQRIYEVLMPIPETTSAEAFARYVGGKVLRVGRGKAWWKSHSTWATPIRAISRNCSGGKQDYPQAITASSVDVAMRWFLAHRTFEQSHNRWSKPPCDSRARLR
jgi:hypothetical protein